MAPACVSGVCSSPHRPAAARSPDLQPRLQPRRRLVLRLDGHERRHRSAPAPRPRPSPRGTKVSNPNASIFADEHVVRFEVAVHKPRLMRGEQALTGAAIRGQDGLCGMRAALPVGKRRALYESHGDVDLPSCSPTSYTATTLG